MTKTFETLDAFQRAVDLTVQIYGLTRQFPAEERYGLASQLRRAAASVVSHIAEGQGRLTNGEWRQFLSQARGSLFEVEAHCIVAYRLGILRDDDYHSLRRLTKEVARPLAGLIEYVRRQEARSRRDAVADERRGSDRSR